MRRAMSVGMTAIWAAGQKGWSSICGQRPGWRVVLLLTVAFCALPAPSQAQQHALRVTIPGAKPKYALTDTVTLKPVVTWRGPNATLSYEWTVLNGPPLSVRAASEKELVIPPEDLRSGSVVKLRFTVTAEWEDADVDPPEKKTEKGQAEVTFEVNAPPRGGECHIDLTRIRDTKADVKMSAPSWKDDDPPIQYRFVLLHKHEKVEERNWSGANTATVRDLVLNTGDHLQLECYIRDRFGSVADKMSAVVSF